MQKIILLTISMVIGLYAYSQKEALLRFEKERIGYQKKSMLVLAGWSAGNMIVSGIATKTSNIEMRNFHQMNVMWGGINLAIAGLGYWGAGREKMDNPNLVSVLKHQNKTKKTYLINSILDVVYVGGGLLMNKTSIHQKNPAKFKGYGNSIVMQGGFLLIFDAVNYAIHYKHGKKLNGLVEKVQLEGGIGAVTLTYTF